MGLYSAKHAQGLIGGAVFGLNLVSLSKDFSSQHLLCTSFIQLHSYIFGSAAHI